jgi:hypothetical protein
VIGRRGDHGEDQAPAATADGSVGSLLLSLPIVRSRACGVDSAQK